MPIERKEPDDLFTEAQVSERSPVARHLACVLLLILSFATLPAFAQSQPKLFAYSTIDALLAGVYDGELTVQELASKGNFGIGTWNRLDGEMIVLDGVFYHAKADGTVSVASPQDRTPLAYVTSFSPTRTMHVGNALGLADLEKWLDARLPNPNLFYAIRVDGVFQQAATRAIPPQAKPYQPLAQVAKTQRVRDFAATRGVLIGFRSPAFSKGISVPGYHWHYITEDRKYGGHVLKLTLVQGEAQVQSIRAFEVLLPETAAFAGANLATDRTEETRQVEGK